VKKLKIAVVAALMASSAQAYTSTNCYWIGSTYTCTTSGGGISSTTRCTMIGTTVSCTSY